jgi:hypothetical protein
MADSTSWQTATIIYILIESTACIGPASNSSGYFHHSSFKIDLMFFVLTKTNNRFA